MSSQTSVLVVGSGPAGLTMALSLLLNGVSVRIIEKAPEFHTGSRGAGIMPRTLEMMKLLGTLSEVERYGALIPQLRSYKPPGGVEPLHTWNLMDHRDPSPSCPYIAPVELGQDVSERILRSHLKEFGCVVELGTELLSFTQCEDGVTAYLVKSIDQAVHRETMHVRYIIGADGAKGIVRKLIGLNFVGETRESDEFIVGDVDVANLSTNFWHFWGQPSDPTTAVSLRPSGPDRKQFAIFIVGRELSKYNLTDPVNFRSFFRQFTGRSDIEFGNFPWLSYFRPNMRMVEKFGEGRVFVVGDAAHVHSPTGGQGMNSSIQDSLNLAWKLALVMKGYAPESLLSTYTEERLPVIAEMLRQTCNLHTKTFAGGELKGGHARGWTRGKLLYMLDINYRWSPIVVDEQMSHHGDGDHLRSCAYGSDSHMLCAGDRAPEAPGLVCVGSHKETSLYNLLTATHHTLVLFPNDEPSKANAVIRSIGSYPCGLIRTIVILRPYATELFDADTTVFDRDGHGHTGYRIDGKGLTVIIVRPDSYIGGIVHGEEGVEHYFSKIIHRP